MLEFLGLGTGVIIAIAAVVLVLVFILWAVGKRNSIVMLKSSVEESWSTIDVYLKKRYDLIPNLIETVKGYAAHEKNTFEAVVNARNAAYNANGVEDKAKAESALNGTLKTLFALSESYPELKADTQFINLQNELRNMENEISQARKYYNGNVKVYNNAILVFPASIVAGMMKAQKQPYFEITDEAERRNVKVSF